MQRESLLYNYREKTYPLILNWDTFRYEDLSLNIDQVREWCREGCPNYAKNGGCPPYSPTAEELLRDKDFILLTCKIYTRDIDAFRPEDKIELMEGILDSFMDELGYKARERLGMDFLNPGYCRGCKECTIESGCKSPGRRVYSITGTGILLADTIKNLFNEELLWLKNGEEPEYYIKIMAFLPKKDHQLSDIEKLLKE